MNNGEVHCHVLGADSHPVTRQSLYTAFGGLDTTLSIIYTSVLILQMLSKAKGGDAAQRYEKSRSGFWTVQCSMPSQVEPKSYKLTH